ncbi:hypothetical protein ID866_7482 [Astraeus odoratus]|nr:hypothetical protein ID866_7482 [Astraeus odoratus]
MITEAQESSRPAWQTDDLEEEWVEGDEPSFGTQSISLTAPLPGFLLTPNASEDNSVESPSSPVVGGTFLIKDDVPAEAFAPKTPARQGKKGGIKDFFSPLPLEKMFEPPSPPPSKPVALPFSTAPAIPSRLSQAFTPDDSQSEVEADTQNEPVEGEIPKSTLPPHYLVPPSSALGINKSVSEYQFTFSAPRHSPLYPQAQSTPGPAKSTINAPATDPRLRLFQLQYDTFTREHLSAIVDSIAVNTPSGRNSEGNGSSSSLVQRSDLNQQASISLDDMPIRSVKRVKLSPPAEFYGEGAGEGATIARPRLPRVDYVGEAQSLMRQIKQARDFSTISTTVTTQSPASHPPQKSQLEKSTRIPPDSGDDAASGHLLMPPLAVSNGKHAIGSSPATTTLSGHSSLAIRKQAEAFMQQIKNDMKGSKRLFSGDTEFSRYTHAEDGAGSVMEQSHHSFWSAATNDLESRSRRKTSRLGSPRRPSTSSKQQPSPCGLRRSVSGEQDKNSVYEVSNMSIEVPWQTETYTATTAAASNPAHNNIPDIKVTTSTIVSTTMQIAPPPSQIPRSYPSSSLGSRSNEDLNRFVSSSTTSGTAITASSAPSFVKHAGPVHITHITPSDVPSLPQRIGRMVYDKDLMKWRKTSVTVASEADEHRDQSTGTDAESEDPFRDIESLREDDSGSSHQSTQKKAEHEITEVVDEEYDQRGHDMSRIEEVEDEEVHDQEEVDLTSFTFDGPSVAAIHVVPSEDDHDSDVTSNSDSDEQGEGAVDVENQPVQSVFDSEDDLSPVSPPKPLLNEKYHQLVAVTPATTASKPAMLTTPMPSRSALKSTSVTPVSAMKDPNRDKFRTPAQRMGHRRSVSFSDGKRDGPIRGLSAKPHESDDDVGTSVTTIMTSDPSQSSSGFSPSARSRRLADMMQKLEITGESNLICFSMSRGSNLTDPDARANATFLTECSFRLAHDKLVQVITDVQPFDPYWEDLNSIDLSRKSLESVARLKEFMPRLDSLTLNFNRLSWLSGVPGPRLEMLNLSQNQLTKLHGLASSLSGLIALNVDGNALEHIEPGGAMPRLRILRASNNRLQTLNAAPFGNLRTLYVDNNTLPSLLKAERLGKLENLSMRNQNCRDFHLPTRQFRDVKRLYLSGNKLRSDFIDEPCYNLIYLEVAACRLTGLPREMGRLVPSLRVLNLNYNFLEDVTALEGLTRMKKLTMIGSRLKGTKPLIRVLQRMPEVEMVDVRMNPCTLGWYLPLLVRDVPGALQPSENREEYKEAQGPEQQGEGRREDRGYGWQELDAKFRRDLPDDVYVGRLAYRGLVMRACPRVRMLDGVEVTEKERTKANHLLQGILSKQQKMISKGKGKSGSAGDSAGGNGT